MNICFITYRENNPYIGGIENVTYLLCKSFIERGHNVMCISQINSQKGKYTPVCMELLFPEKKELNSDTNRNFLETTIKKYGINIIINQYSINKQTIELCNNIKHKIPEIKIVTPLHFDLFYEEKAISNNFFIRLKNGRNISKWIKDILLFTKFHLCQKYIIRKRVIQRLRYIAQTSDHVISLSQSSKEEAANLLKGEYSEKFLTIGNPIEICNKQAQTKENTILYVGRLEFGLKRFDRMLYIWEKLEKKNPDWKLIVLGDGQYRNMFERKTKELKLERVLFKGFADPSEYYRTASIVCLTSSSEGFAKVLAEAQSYSCIPIAFDSFSAINDIISNTKNGFCIKAFNKHLFTEQLQKLMRDKNTIKSIGEQAKKDSIKFSIEKITDKWEEIFNR